MAMAAAMAKVLRGARSGSSSQLLIPSVLRGVAQGPSPAAPAAVMGRLMHTGTKLPFGRQALSQQRKIARMEQFCGRRSYMGGHGPVHLPFSALAVVGAMALCAYVPNSNIWKRIKKKYIKEE